MSKLIGAIDEIGTRLGLQSRPVQGRMYGLKDGYPLQLTHIKNDSGESIELFIRFKEDVSLSTIKNIFEHSVPLKSAGIKPKEVKIGESGLSYTKTKGLFKKIDTEDLYKKLSAVFDTLKETNSSFSGKCRMCKLNSVNEARLVNGIVDVICLECIEKLKHEAKLLEDAYENKSTRWLFALITGAFLALVGGIIWGGIIIASNTMYWIVAMLVGMMIGFGTVKAAGKKGPGVQIICFAYTILSILSGQLFYAGYLIDKELQKQGMVLDIVKFIQSAPSVLIELGGDSLFALVGGLFGAIIAAGYAAKEKFGIKVE